MFRQYFKQAIQMLKENRLTSVISILGTALSIAMILVVILQFQIKLVGFRPESNRDRMLYIMGIRADSRDSDCLLYTSINGKSQGKRTKDLSVELDSSYTEAAQKNFERQKRYRLMWMDTKYEPGTLKVVAYDKDGNAVAEEEVHTAGKPHHIELTADRDRLKADGKEMCIRDSDIPLHVEAFVSALSSKIGKTIRTISPDYVRILKRYPWKGNVRELRNVVERSLIISDGDTLTADTLPLTIQNPQDNTDSSYSGFDLDGVEKMHIQEVLKYTNGNKTETCLLYTSISCLKS